MLELDDLNPQFYLFLVQMNQYPILEQISHIDDRPIYPTPMTNLDIAGKL